MKRKLFYLIGLILITVMFFGCSKTTGESEVNENNLAKDPIETTLKNMTITEKIGQMMTVGIYGYEINDDILYSLHQYHFGGVILFTRNIESKEQVTNFVSDLQNKSDEKVPLFIAIDEEGGRVSRLRQIDNEVAPSQEEIGNGGELESAKIWAVRIAEKLKKIGANVNFAPVADVGSPDTRSFSNNAEVVADFVNSAASGYEEQKLIYCLKHFPGIGKRVNDPHQEISSIEVSRQTLDNEDILPFKSVISSHSPDNFMIMVSHLKYPAIDEKNSATLSYEVMTNLLRKELAYKGVIITDDLEMGAVANHNEFTDVGVNAVKAGADILLVCHDYQHEQEVYEGLLEAVKNGDISEERINESVRRILKLKFKNLID